MSFVTTAIRGVMSPEKSSAPLPAAGSFLESQEIAMTTPYSKSCWTRAGRKNALRLLRLLSGGASHVWMTQARCMSITNSISRGVNLGSTKQRSLLFCVPSAMKTRTLMLTTLQWVSSFAPVCGPLDRFDASWLLAGAPGMSTDAVPDYPHAKTMSFVGGVAVAMANKVWLCQGVSGFSSLDPLEVADVAVKAVFEHFNLSIERKQEFR